MFTSFKTPCTHTWWWSAFLHPLLDWTELCRLLLSILLRAVVRDSKVVVVVVMVVMGWLRDVLELRLLLLLLLRRTH